MTSWLSRNAVPIGVVVFAAVLVIAGFELLDALSSSEPANSEGESDELEGIASIAGLIKVALFLGFGALIARPLRRRVAADRSSSNDET